MWLLWWLRSFVAALMLYLLLVLYLEKIYKRILREKGSAQEKLRARVLPHHHPSGEQDWSTAAAAHATGFPFLTNSLAATTGLPPPSPYAWCPCIRLGLC
jgi:hypothetical protein